MRTLKKLNESKDQFFNDKFYVFDTETYGLNPQMSKLAFGVIYGHNFIRILRTPEEFQEEFKNERYSNKKIFAHNAEYDISSTFGNIIENVDTGTIFNGKFISSKYHKTAFCDSMNIYPASVDKIGKILGYEKGVTPDKFINPEKYTPEQLRINSLDIEYCIRDCKIVYEALLQMFDRVGGIRITIASTSMYYFRKKFLTHDINYSKLNDKFFDSYYGGRTEAFQIGKVNAKVYDINSLYPSVMDNMIFPDFKNLHHENNISYTRFKKMLQYKEGYAHVDIIHKQSYFGTLPFKSNKLLFPVGKFTTYVNFNELRFALNTGLIEIKKVHSAVFGNPIETIFHDFVQTVYNERVETSNELMKLILKLILNSLYGKFGMRYKFSEVYYKEIPFELIDELKSKNLFYKLKMFSHERTDCYLILENEQFKRSFFSIPSIASYITSEARTRLLKGLLNNQDKKIVYCDTDSIFLEDWEKPNLNISNKLGDWKLEDKHIIEVRGLKNYTYLDEKGNEKDAIKGVSKRSKEIERFKFETTKYVKTKEAIRRNLEAGKQIRVVKTVTNKYDKRIVLPNGNTLPLTLK